MLPLLLMLPAFDAYFARHAAAVATRFAMMMPLFAAAADSSQQPNRQYSHNTYDNTYQNTILFRAIML